MSENTPAQVTAQWTQLIMPIVITIVLLAQVIPPLVVTITELFVVKSK